MPNPIESLIKYLIQQIFIAYLQVKGTVLDARKKTVNKRDQSPVFVLNILVAGGCWISSKDSVIY